ncbi:MAG: GNAT family N-acetyltransferase [Anaerolineales bacterium]|nr:GNAT family N-acetyltransferase [Anaerolineales bacterium]
MNLTLHTYAEQPEVIPLLFSAVKLPAWQYEFMFNDEVANRLWHRLEADFVDYQFVLRDQDAGGAIAAVGHTLPFQWDATIEDLPDRGWDAIFERAVEGLDAGRPPNMLTAIEASVAPAYQGQGVSRRIIEEMRNIARARGFGVLVAPVRPSLKARYPLTPIDRYVSWTQGAATGDPAAPFDPWLRTHWRMGARIVKVAHNSMRITGPVARWERWTGMQFPESGQYIVPGALNPVAIDREQDSGEYIEPNVWMAHQVSD